MSYCVNCGVELDESAKKCALCQTPVINPNKNEKAPTECVTPFSQITHVPKELQKKFVALVVSLVMLIPNIVCFIVNAVIFPTSFWSIYVMATSLLVWTVVVLPFFIKKHRAYFMWAFNTAAASLYVYLFYVMGRERDKWYTECALPIILFVSVLTLIYLIWVRRKKRGNILKALVICINIAFASLICGLILSVGAGVNYATEIGFILFLCIMAVVAFLTYCYNSKSMRKWLSERMFT